MEHAIRAGELGGAPLRRFSRADFHRMGDIGIFNSDERVELLAGVLVAMSPQNPPHADAVWRIPGLLRDRLGKRAIVRAQLPLVVGDYSEPEPDVAVVPSGDYGTQHPSSAWLVVEVADSSLRLDRMLKARLYATAAVPDYWIVNLVDDCVEVHRAPTGETFSSVTTHRRGEVLALVAFPDVTLAVEELLPRR